MTTAHLIRRTATAADLPEVLVLAQASDVALIGETDWTEADLREEWESYDLERDVVLLELDGRLAGYAAFEDRGGGRLLVDGYVHPELTGRGVGAELIRLTELRASEELDAIEAGGRVYLQNASLASDPAASTLFPAQGYEEVRRSWRMVIDLDRAPEPRELQGVEVRLYREPEERQAVHETIEEAFADHWQHRRRSFEEWSGNVFRVEGYDPSLVWVAHEGDEIVAANVCFWKRHGEWGWVGSIGVRPPWRRRGIAEALLETAFAEFFRRGERRVALGVDAQSPTGATRLYEKAGMRVFWEAVVWEKELRAAGG
ncbi:MAG TPA: GNAT family N-acetyltransferase [Gaiellaceae bacterium]|nr:GNAT family N-acetyltransferase [Gaiellaceae bacterium]